MALYGDLMTALSYTLFLPMYIHGYMVSPSARAPIVIFFLASACIVLWLAWARNHSGFSILGFLLQVGCFSSMAIFEWPYGNDSTLIPQFLWAITIHIGSDLSLSSRTKVSLILFALLAATVSTVMTDTLATESTLTICFGATLVICIVHLHPKNLKDELLLFSAQAAALVLAFVYAHHLATEIVRMASVPGYAATGGYNIVKMGFLASMGIVATGAFRDQVSIRQSLQSLVMLKGTEMARQAETMQMISIALEASETAIAITDSHATIIWSNRAMETLLRVDSVESNNKVSLVEALQLSAEENLTFLDCFATDRKSMELRLNETDIKLNVSSFTVVKEDNAYSDAGAVERYLVSLSDITQLRAREQAERAAAQAAVQRAAMQESMETLTHELRTPLQGIIGMTSMVYENNNQVSPEETHQCMSTVMASSRLLLTLINNLLDSHKMDANMMNAFQLQPVSLAPAMRDAAHFCQPIATINETDIRLLINFDERENVVVKSNPVRFQQVLVNLVSNAIKYAGRGVIQLRAELVSVDEANGRIQNALAVGLHPRAVNAPPTSRVALVSVEDSGAGIPEEMAGLVFQKFSQYTDTNSSSAYGASLPSLLTTNSSGTGIGLNLCCRFVQRMDGNIWVSNHPDGGACFSFCLPVLSTQDLSNVTSLGPLSFGAAIQPPEPVDERQPSGAVSYEALKVLVVDDTLINLKVLERMIKRISSTYHVTTVSSGEQALQALYREHFDLVITDIQMPRMDGIALSRAIRASAAITPKPRVVALTAETSESLHRRCRAAGVAHILHKPIAAQQLRDFFAAAMAGAEPLAAAASLRPRRR